MTLFRLPHLRIAGWHLWWQVQWKIEDLWIGAFWQDYPGKIYLWICFVPCLPLHLELWKPGTGHQ